MASKPMVSYFLMTYKHEAFIEKAVESALAQTYSPMEIIISDDASPDNTLQVIEKCLQNYKGEHTVILNKNNHTMGLVSHINKLVGLAKGEFFIASAGDDISHPDRVESLVQALNEENTYAVHSNANLVDEKGVLLAKLFPKPLNHIGGDWMQIINKGITRVSGSTLAVRREVFDVFGALPEYLPCEDQVLAFRAALLGGLKYLNQPLVQYRTHGENISYWSSSLNAKSNHELLEIKYKQAMKRVAEKKVMLHDIKELRKQGKGDCEQCLQKGESKLECVLKVEQFSLEMFAAERPYAIRRVSLFLALVMDIGFRTIPFKKLVNLLGLVVSTKLYIWNTKAKKRSVNNRVSLDA